MPERKNKVRLETSEVQGKDSYVDLTLPTVGEVESVLEVEGKSLDAFQQSSVTVAAHIVGWNWVDDDGNQLPLPRDEPGIMKILTAEEFKVLVNGLFGSEEKRKN